MADLRRSVQWFTLAFLFSGAGLSIFGAFLGAETAKQLFNSWPMALYWGVFGVVLAGGFLVFTRLRRGAGLAGMHLGMLLVILGSMVNSDAGHRVAGRLTGRPKILRSYLRLEEGQTSERVFDDSLRRELGRLPFAVRLDAFDVAYYPPAMEPPPLFYGVLVPEPGSPHLLWQTLPLEWQPGKTARLADTSVEFKVERFTSASEGEDLKLTLELSSGGVKHTHTLVCPPEEPFVRMALHPLFPALTNLHRSASLLLAQPVPAVREYRSRVTILQDGVEAPADIRVNHPLRVGGYWLYQQAWGEDPARHSVLLVVSDSGLGMACVGFALLAGGTVMQFWHRRAVAA